MPIHITGPAHTTVTIAFPIPSPATARRLTAALNRKKTTHTIVTIDHTYGITGSMFQRLCGDHTGTPYDGGRLYSIQLRGFLRLLEIAADKSLLVFDEAASDLIHSTD